MNDSHLVALKYKREVRALLLYFIIGLVLSGLTAFPIETELDIAYNMIDKYSLYNSLTVWLENVRSAVHEVNIKYPFFAYGTDWLAFAHLVIAIAFIGPLRNPVKNIWVIQFGLYACVAVFPLALIAGEIRSIPWFWRIIDCSFGAIGGVILWFTFKKTKVLEMIEQSLTGQGENPSGTI